MNSKNIGTAVNPNHYHNCSLECIDSMRIVFGTIDTLTFCEMTAYKYLWRHVHKNGQEDLDKAKRYIDMATKINDGHVTPRCEDMLKVLETEMEKYEKWDCDETD